MTWLFNDLTWLFYFRNKSSIFTSSRLKINYYFTLPFIPILSFRTNICLFSIDLNKIVNYFKFSKKICFSLFSKQCFYINTHSTQMTGVHFFLFFSLLKKIIYTRTSFFLSYYEKKKKECQVFLIHEFFSIIRN